MDHAVRNARGFMDEVLDHQHEIDLDSGSEGEMHRVAESGSESA